MLVRFDLMQVHIELDQSHIIDINIVLNQLSSSHLNITSCMNCKQRLLQVIMFFVGKKQSFHGYVKSNILVFAIYNNVFFLVCVYYPTVS